ncbi:hypothetical protein KEJ37_03310 [Candidatus Bathyarchaeota archaeon]|nr:hypothetical protein [Candidatus Bathyarchaeota archaeon]
MPSKKRHRKSIIDELFGGSIFDEIDELFNEFSEGEIIGGYSISVAQTPEGTKVKAKVGKDVDVNALKRRLQQQYPGAQIEIEGGKQEPLIKEISTRSVGEEENSEEG